MRKTIFLLIVGLLAAVLSACGNSTTLGGETQSADSDTASVETASETETTDQKTLVVYYSASGNTKAVAEVIARDTGGDLFELTPAQAYTEDDLNWSEPDSRVSREHDDESLRNVPLEETSVDNWDAYDTVYIGYPIWWGIAAWPVNSFVTANDFTGKAVIPFCTSSSSDLGESGALLADMAGNGNWQEGHRFRSNVSENDVSEWVRSEATRQSESKAHTEETEKSEEDSVQEESNILVAYFSRTGENYNVGTIETGNTQIIADMITEAVGADEFSITPTQPYPDDYQQMLDVLREEYRTNARPKIQNQVENMDSYDTVFIGYPIWGSDMPYIVYHFLESYDFSGKTIVPFSTNEGSGLSGTVERIRELLPDADVKEGFSIRGTTAQNDRDTAETEVTEWLGEGQFIE